MAARGGVVQLENYSDARMLESSGRVEGVVRLVACLDGAYWTGCVEVGWKGGRGKGKGKGGRIYGVSGSGRIGVPDSRRTAWMRRAHEP